MDEKTRKLVWIAIRIQCWQDAIEIWKRCGSFLKIPIVDGFSRMCYENSEYDWYYKMEKYLEDLEDRNVKKC